MELGDYVVERIKGLERAENGCWVGLGGLGG
jgi:hypothetical protein